MTPNDLSALDAAVKRVSRLAARLGAGDAESHVQRSLAELAAAIGRQDPLAHSLDRLATSLRQLQMSREHGLRRVEQHGAIGVERVLETIQEEIMPLLRGRL